MNQYQFCLLNITLLGSGVFYLSLIEVQTNKQMSSRTERFLQLQNLRAHYKNMVNVQPTYMTLPAKEPKNSSKDSFKNVHTHQLKKPEKQREMEILANNFRLIRNLQRISRGKERNHRLTSECTTIHSSSPQKRTKNAQQAYWNEVERENLSLMRRLGSVQPTIITKRQCKKQYKTHRQQLKRLAKSVSLAPTRQQKLVKDSFETLKSQLSNSRKITSARSRSSRYLSKQNRQSDKSTHNGASVYDDIQQDCIRQLKEKEIYQQS